MDNCSDQFFPCIKQMLLVLGILPVSVATAERSFSTLRRLYTNLIYLINPNMSNIYFT